MSKVTDTPAVGLPRSRRADGGAALFGAWPHTRRVLPWMLAGFIAMVWLLPFDAMTLPFSLPFDSKLDRVYMAVFFMVWVLAWATGTVARPRLRLGPIAVPILLFAGAALLSVLLDVEVLSRTGDLQLALKQVALLMSFVAFFLLASSILRPVEVGRFITLTIVLGCITSVAAIYEYRTGTNIFYDWTRTLAGGLFHVGAENSEGSGYGRAIIQGPTGHPLVLATMITLVVPLAMTRLLAAKDRRTRIWNGIAAGILLAGMLVTVRRTAVFAPAAALLVLACYRPRQMARLAPWAIVFVIAMQAVAPAALSTIRYTLQPSTIQTDGSVDGRTEDYSATSPDILQHPALGRGFGSYDPHKYRILDNAYLGTAVETGVIGLALLLAIFITIGWGAHRVSRRGHPQRSPTAIGLVASTAAFAVATLLYDSTSYPQAVYVLFFIGAIVSVYLREEKTSGPTIRPDGEPQTSFPLIQGPDPQPDVSPAEREPSVAGAY